MIIVMTLFSKSPVFKMFSIHPKAKSRSNSRSLKSVFEKPPILDGLVLMTGLTGEIRLHFKNFSSVAI